MLHARVLWRFTRKLQKQLISLELNRNKCSLFSLQFLKKFKSVNSANFCNSSIFPQPSENSRTCCKQLPSPDHEQYILKLLLTLEQGFVFDDLEDSDLQVIFDQFALKGLDVQYFHKYNARVSSCKTAIMFPFENLDKEFSAIQTLTCTEGVFDERLITNHTSKKKNMLLFGWSLIGPNEKEVVVTSHPIDAIAVNQATNAPAISLSHEFSSFSPEILDVFKSFTKVTFWLRPQFHDWKTHKLLKQCLGKTAYFIRPCDFNNAVKCLQSSSSLKHILSEAFPIYDENVNSYDSYVNLVHEELKGHEQNAGLKWKRFSVLNELLKGHRKGELTIFSGQTGTGKTTFMSEYSLDLCIQGRPTLWASFEITNSRLMKTMLSQFAQCTLVELLDAHDFWSRKFRELPMFFLEYHGARSLKRILKAMTNAVIVFNIEHIVIDNLQFMMNMEEYNSSLDQFRRQDQIFSAFREFATNWKCHITIVMHPRKEPENTELSINSISGTAKASQEADSVLILQTTKSRQFLQVTKNRFDGHKGCVIVEFNKDNQTFSVKKMTSKFKETDKVL